MSGDVNAQFSDPDSIEATVSSADSVNATISDNKAVNATVSSNKDVNAEVRETKDLGAELTIPGSTEFTGLTDTPSDYAGESGKVPVVNQSGDSLKFEEKLDFGGYSKGDFVPLFNFDVNSTTASTTSDTFTRVFSNVQPFAFSYNSVYPADVTPAVSMTLTVSPQGDKIFYRLRNRQDNDVYLSGQKSGSNFELVKLGPKKFVNDSTQDLDLHAIDIKNQDNSTQVQVFSVSVRFGFIL